MATLGLDDIELPTNLEPAIEADTIDIEL